MSQVSSRKSGSGEVRVTKVSHNGVDGLFFGTPTELGFQATDGSQRITIPAEAVKRADWNDGILTVRHGEMDAEEPEKLDDLESFEVDGMLAAYVNQLRQYFESACNTFLHRSSAVVTAQEFDLAIKVAEDAAYRVNKTAPGSVARMAKELDLMERLEDVCNRLTQLTRGDKQVLNDIFSANECERIGRLKLILEKCDVKLCADDSRWLQLDTSAAIVQNVLKESGTYRVWTAAQSQDIWLRRAETVVADDVESLAGVHDDDGSDDDEDEAEAVAAKEADAYVPSAELVSMLKAEPAPEEETISISVDGKEFSFPLKLARSLDYWDMFEAVSQRVKARKMLTSGSEICELLFNKSVLSEDTWDDLRTQSLTAGCTLVAKTREAAAKGDVEKKACGGYSCFLCGGLLFVLTALAGVCLFMYFKGSLTGSGVSASGLVLDPEITYDKQAYSSTSAEDLRVTIQEWMEGTEPASVLTTKMESLITFEVENPSSATASKEEVTTKVEKYSRAKQAMRVEDNVKVLSGIREYIDETKKDPSVNPGEPALSLLLRVAIFYGTRGGETGPNAPLVNKFKSLPKKDVNELEAIFYQIADDPESGVQEPARITRIFEKFATTDQHVARALATIFFHPLGKDIQSDSTCLLEYLLAAVKVPEDASAVSQRIIKKIKTSFGIDVDFSLASSTARAGVPAVWLVASAAAALGLAARHRVGGRRGGAASTAGVLQLADASPLLSEEP